VVWESAQDFGVYGAGIVGQRYDGDGAAQGGEFLVSTYTPIWLGAPSVASAADGSFVAAWWGSSGFPPSAMIRARRYDSQGAPRGNDFRVSFSGGYDFLPRIASDASGAFVIAWTSQYLYGGNRGVFGRRYNSAGNAQGLEFQINSYTPALGGSVAYDTHGNFVVVWSNAQTGWDVLGRRYASDGTTQGNEFRINTFTTGDQSGPSVATMDVDKFVVAWSSGGQDGSGRGAFGQRLDFGGAPTIHAGDLDRRAKNVGASWRAQVKTLVHDDVHGPLSGVLVTLDVTGVGARTCTTTGGGICEVSVLVPDSVPSLTFSVTNLSKAGFSYHAGANHDPDPDSDGTTIVVNRP
jgi:hypothetical protein